MVCRPLRLVLLLAFAVIVAGCEAVPAPSDTTTTSVEQPMAARSSASAGADEAFDPDLERRLKSQPPRPRAVARSIDWLAADSVAAGAVTRLDSDGALGLSDVPLPALLPDDAELIGMAIITRGETWYAASMTVGDLNVFVTGSALAQRLPRSEPGLHGGSLPAPLLSRNELSPMASFEAFGAAYHIAVECAAPLEDERCTGDDYVLSLVDSLARFGGQP